MAREAFANPFKFQLQSSHFRVISNHWFFLQSSWSCDHINRTLHIYQLLCHGRLEIIGEKALQNEPTGNVL
ncbi:hypothetical protein LINPERHAP1_LOCUS36773 [Linum perenne]